MKSCPRLPPKVHSEVIGVPRLWFCPPIAHRTRSLLIFVATFLHFCQYLFFLRASSSIAMSFLYAVATGADRNELPVHDYRLHRMTTNRARHRLSLPPSSFSYIFVIPYCTQAACSIIHPLFACHPFMNSTASTLAITLNDFAR